MKVRDIINKSHQVNYAVVCEQSETGWAAYAPDLPGVITTSQTKAGARSLILEAIEFHRDGLKEDRLPVPQPSAEGEVVSVPER